ncbi:Uncharacterised protein [Budvicia aquatica]|uniref:Uncharacterized protein n=1 Tax=Budvicia aquatica TaxID=82979 RepID=A0A2C6DJH2_9GAMM|nr:hypothetical protein CRN84_14535 [Budvicia aquatica]VFS49685.1 Uncharacterised protein [Budvicia aquatica]
MQIDTLIIIAIVIMVAVLLISRAIVGAMTKQSGMSITYRVLIFSSIFGLLFFILISIVLASI